MRVRFTQAARRHKIGKARVLYVLEHPRVTATIQAPAGSDRADRTLHLGDDHTGRTLEVVTVDIAEGWLVLHAMDMREKYRGMFENGNADA